MQMLPGQVARQAMTAGKAFLGRVQSKNSRNVPGMRPLAGVCIGVFSQYRQ